MGQISSQLSRLDDALNFYTKAVEIHRKRAALNASDVQIQIDLAFGHYRVGDVEQSMNDIGGAIKSYEKALSLLQSLETSTRLSPEDAKSVKDMKDAVSQLRKLLHQSGVEGEIVAP